jgi:hypothetical protein
MIPKLIKMSRQGPWLPPNARAFTSTDRALAYEDGDRLLICDRRNKLLGNPFKAGTSVSTSWGRLIISDGEDAANAFETWLRGGVEILDGRQPLRQQILDSLPDLQHIDYLACWCGKWTYNQVLAPDCHCVSIILRVADLVEVMK